MVFDLVLARLDCKYRGGIAFCLQDTSRKTLQCFANIEEFHKRATHKLPRYDLFQRVLLTKTMEVQANSSV